MPLTRNSQPDGSIPISDMRDGQIAEITAWDQTQSVGDIVQRCGSALIRIGYPCGSSWSCLFEEIESTDDLRYRVRILPDGGRLIVLGNQ